MDKNDAKASYFSYEASTKEFKQLSGKKKFNVLDQAYEPLGTVEFDFETLNFTSKEESQKTQEKDKKVES